MIFKVLKTTWKNHKKLVGFFYLKSLIGSLTAAVPLYFALQKLNTSYPILNLLAHDFDYMLLTDFFRLEGDSLTPFLYGFPILFVLNTSLNIFFTGGILDVLNTKTYSLKRFLNQSAKHTKKTFKITLLLSTLGLATLILTFFAAVILQNWLANPNYKTNVLIYLPAVLILITGTILIFMLWDYCRIISFKKDNLNTIETFIQAKHFIFSSFAPLQNIVVLFLFVGLGLTFYLLTEQLLNSIFIIFVLQQLFSIYKCYLRVFYINLLNL